MCASTDSIIQTWYLVVKVASMKAIVPRSCSIAVPVETMQRLGLLGEFLAVIGTASFVLFCQDSVVKQDLARTADRLCIRPAVRLAPVVSTVAATHSTG